MSEQEEARVSIHYRVMVSDPCLPTKVSISLIGRYFAYDPGGSPGSWHYAKECPFAELLNDEQKEKCPKEARGE